MSAYSRIGFNQWVTVRFARRLVSAVFNWRSARFALLGIATLATTVAVVYAFENWRGDRAWSHTKRQLEAKGERLDLIAFVPPRVPDEENFAAAPFWREAIPGYDPESPPAKQLFVIGDWSRVPAPQGGDWLKGERIKMSDWQRHYRDLHAATESSPADRPPPIPEQPGVPAEDVLIALSRNEREVERLREAARRPSSRFPVRLEHGWRAVFPHLRVLNAASADLRLRAVAKLHLGRADDAFADVLLQLRLVSAMEGEASLVSQLSRVWITKNALQCIWEGAADHRWSASHLARFQRELGRLDVLAAFEASCAYERSMVLTLLDEAKLTRDATILRVLHGIYGRPDGQLNYSRSIEGVMRRGWFYRLMPRGWFDFNKAFCAQTMAELRSPRANPAAEHVAIAEWRQRLARARGRRPTPYSFLCLGATQWQDAVSLRFFHHVALVRITLVACALERYRLAHGQYPDRLEQLAPTFIGKLPHDVIDGGELKFHRTSNGRFELYSIGWNGKDDGAEVALIRKGPHSNPKEGDWVWRYPAG